jgi:type II secretory pathway component PulF
VPPKLFSGPNQRDLIWICRRLAARLQEGLTIAPALEAVAAEAPERMRAPLRAMRESMGSGGRLAQELAGHGAPAFVSGAVWRGECAAALDRALTLIADRLEAEQGIKPPRDRGLLAYSLALGRLGMLLVVGAPLVQALEAAAESAGESEAGGALAAARKEMLQGGTLSDALERSAAGLPTLAIDMIRDGESDGRLHEALPIIADYVLDASNQAGPARHE